MTRNRVNRCARSARRPLIPVVWAHHDDGHYIGRPYTPLPEFAAKLADANAAGFGIIHWTTRPLDLYFTSLARQVWQRTKDEPLPDTCNHMAARVLGDPRLGKYLHRWITEAPRFARETSDYFIDRPLTDIPGVVANCRDRLALLRAADNDRVKYYKGLERFIAAFYETHDLFQRSQAALKNNDLALARQLMAQCRPESVIEQFAKFSSLGGIMRGEQGLVVSMNLRGSRTLSVTGSARAGTGADQVRSHAARQNRPEPRHVHFPFHAGTCRLGSVGRRGNRRSCVHGARSD